jgi:hypothetical protein
MLWHMLKRLLAIMVGIKKVMGRLGTINIALFIGANGVFGYKFNIASIETRHSLRQRKNCKPVYAVMSKEPPRGAKSNYNDACEKG